MSSSGSMCPPGGSQSCSFWCQCNSVAELLQTKPETVKWRSIGVRVPEREARAEPRCG